MEENTNSEKWKILIIFIHLNTFYLGKGSQLPLCRIEQYTIAHIN